MLEIILIWWLCVRAKEVLVVTAPRNLTVVSRLGLRGGSGAMSVEEYATDSPWAPVSSWSKVNG